MPVSEFLDTLKGDVSDIPPVFIRDFTLGMDVLGIKTNDILSDNGFNAELSADSICAFQKFTGQDAVIGCTHSPAFIVEQFGGRMKYPEYGIPNPAVHPLEDSIDFSAYDISPKGIMKDALKSYSLVKERLPDTAVVGNVTGPLTKASVLAGMERVSMLIHSDRDVLRDLISLGFENTKAAIEMMHSDSSIDAGIVAAATDNPDLFCYQCYHDISVPWIEKLTDVFHKFGYPVVYHPHGSFVTDDEDHSDDLLKMKFDGFHFSENNNYPKIAKLFKGKKCTLGGTSIVPALIGEPEEVVKETEFFMETFRENSYVFMASCSVHRGVPLDNIRLMCNTVNQFQRGRV